MRSEKIVISFLILFYAIVLIRTAWVCDDAYITFRTVDNLAHGYGLTWNTDERVQAYTHPLWMLLVSAFYAITSEIYYTNIFLSISLSLAAVLIFAFRISESGHNSIVGVTLLIFSKAFVDYSTSGLENALTHLILVLFFLVYFSLEKSNRKLFFLSFIASLGILNRMDASLLFLPVLVASIFDGPVRLERFYPLLLGFVPILFWEGFSLFYYGFLFPNTAYAKFSGYVSMSYLVGHGFFYLWDSFLRDPVTLSTIIATTMIPILRKDKALLPLIYSIALYMLYVVRIGGDFMSGRFLTVPFFCSVIALSRINLGKFTPAMVLSGILAIFLYQQSALFGSTSYGIGYSGTHDSFEHRGIIDSRALHYPHSGLLRARFQNPLTSDPSVIIGKKLREDARPIFVARGIGYVGFYAGPSVHIVDLNALADPFLARLPPIKQMPRIAHFVREIPQGYIPTLESGRNKITDLNLALYYEKLSKITRGPLLSRERFYEIWKMNLGQEDHLLESYISKAK